MYSMYEVSLQKLDLIYTSLAPNQWNSGCSIFCHWQLFCFSSSSLIFLMSNFEDYMDISAAYGCCTVNQSTTALPISPLVFLAAFLIFNFYSSFPYNCTGINHVK